MKFLKILSFMGITATLLYAGGERIWDVWEVKYKPVLIQKIRPKYPEVAKKKRIEGEVRVSIIVNEKGEVESAKIVASSNPIFNKACLEAVYKFKFKPGRIGNKNVKVKLLIPFIFKIAK